MSESLNSSERLRARRRAKRRILFTALYLILALVIRLIYLREFSESPLFTFPLGADVEEYSAWAKEILGGSFLWNAVRIHSPLYPYFLASLLWLFDGRNALPLIRAFQTALGFLAVVPLSLALKLGLDRGPGGLEPGSKVDASRFHRVLFIFLALWAWYPPLIYYLGELISEVLLVPLLSLAIYCLYFWDAKSPESPDASDSEGEDEASDSAGLSDVEPEPPVPRRLNILFGAGLFIGLAVLAHPMAMFFGLLELIHHIIRAAIRRKDAASGGGWRFLPPLALALGIALPILPLAYYNTVVLGSHAPLQANAGFNFFLGNGPGADGTCRVRPGPAWNSLHAEAAREGRRKGVSKDAVFVERAINHIRNHPLDWLRLLFRKALYVWNWRELTAGADNAPLRYFTPFQSWFKWAFGFCAVMALAGVFLNFGNPTFFNRYRHFLLLVLAFWLAQTLLVTSGRYRVGMLPAVLILSAVGVEVVVAEMAVGARNALRALAALLAAFVVVWLPHAPFHPERERAEASTLIGEALIRRGFPEAAERFLAASAKARPNYSRNYNLLGLSFEKRRMFADAEKAYKKAIEVAPGDPTAYSNLATLYSARGRSDKADLYFKMAYSLAPPSPITRYNHALHCERYGRLADAVREYEACLRENPGHVMALNNLGVIAFKKGDYRQAAILFKRALRFDSRNYNRMVNLAAALFLSNDRQAAMTWLRKALKENPESPKALELLKRMKSRQR